MAEVHVTEVVREAGRYWVKCELCGTIASSQTQKAVMLQRAEQHRASGGSPVTRQPRAGRGATPIAATKVATKQAPVTPSGPTGMAPVHQRRTPFANSTAFLTNTCRDCQGPLKATSDGHYHETPDLPTRSVCCDCRVKLLPKNHVLACQVAKGVVA